MAQAVPLAGTISLHDLSAAVSIDEVNLARILRLLMTERIFAEPSPGQIAHSAASKHLATDLGMQAVVGHMLEALEKFKGSQELTASAWTLNFWCSVLWVHGSAS